MTPTKQDYEKAHESLEAIQDDLFMLDEEQVEKIKHRIALALAEQREKDARIAETHGCDDIAKEECFAHIAAAIRRGEA